MLQRIQTLWLLLASISLLCLFLFSYAEVINSEELAQNIRVTGVYQRVDRQLVKTQEFTLLTIATVTLALIPMLIIFSYKNRQRQTLLGYITILAIMAYIFWMTQAVKQVVGSTPLEIHNYSIGVLLAPLSILFIILALRGINKDEKLLQSADRLRSV